MDNHLLPILEDLEYLGIDAYCHIVHTYGHNDDYGFEADKDVIVIRFKNNNDLNLCILAGLIERIEEDQGEDLFTYVQK